MAELYGFGVEVKKHRVYIACAYSRIGFARSAARHYRAMGAEVVSGWHDAPEQDEHALSEEDRADLWGANISDLDGADLVIVITTEGAPRTTWAEVGYAIARGIPVSVVAPTKEGATLPLVCYARGVTRC